MLSHKRGLRTKLRIRRYDKKMGSRGAAPPKEIYILRSPKWENQGQNQVQSIKTEKTRKAEKSVRAVWYIRLSGFRPGGNFSIRAGTSREHQILEIK